MVLAECQLGQLGHPVQLGQLGPQIYRPRAPTHSTYIYIYIIIYIYSPPAYFHYKIDDDATAKQAGAFLENDLPM